MFRQGRKYSIYNLTLSSNLTLISMYNAANTNYPMRKNSTYGVTGTVRLP